MRTRVLWTIAALALIASACGGGAEEQTAPVVVAGGEGVAAMELAYTFGTYEDVAYALDASVDMTMSMDGSGAAAQGMPGDIVAAMDMAGVATFGVSPGPEPGTREIGVAFDISSLDIRQFEMDGESILGEPGSEDLLAMAGTDDLFTEMSMVIDEHGNVLSIGVGDASLPVDMFGGTSMGGGFGDLLGPTSFFGPAFPEGELAVGSAWSLTDSVEVPMMGNVTTTSDFEVVDGTVKDGHSLFLIQSTTTMDRIDVDLMEAFREMAASDADSLAAMGMTPQDLDFMTEMMGGFDMRMMMKAEPSTTLTWFDATAGLVTESVSDVDMSMVMDMEVPGEGSVSMNMDMTATVGMTYLSRTATS